MPANIITASSIDLTSFIPWINLLGGALAGYLAATAKLKICEHSINVLNGHHKDNQNSMNEFRTAIATLNEFKTQTQKYIDKNIYKSSSPLSLTDLGKELIKESGLEKILETEKNTLISLLNKMNPKTKYDVQEMARSLMDNLKEYPAFEPVKTYAFNTGKDFGQILRAGAIPLRDFYLAHHPEITK